jgi:hypothetical protein
LLPDLKLAKNYSLHAKSPFRCLSSFVFSNSIVDYDITPLFVPAILFYFISTSKCLTVHPHEVKFQIITHRTLFAASPINSTKNSSVHLIFILRPGIPPQRQHATQSVSFFRQVPCQHFRTSSSSSPTKTCISWVVWYYYLYFPVIFCSIIIIMKPRAASARVCL